MRAGGLADSLHPPAEVPGLGPPRLLPGHTQCPAEAGPAQEVHPIGAQGGHRAPSRLQVGQELPHRLQDRPIGADEPVGLERPARLGERAHLGDHQDSQVP